MIWDFIIGGIAVLVGILLLLDLVVGLLFKPSKHDDWYDEHEGL